MKLAHTLSPAPPSALQFINSKSVNAGQSTKVSKLGAPQISETNQC